MRQIIYIPFILLFVIATYVVVSQSYFNLSLFFPKNPIQIIIDTDKDSKSNRIENDKGQGKIEFDKAKINKAINELYPDFGSYLKEKDFDRIKNENKLYKVVTKSTMLNARSDRTTSSKVLFKIPNGSIIEALELKGKSAFINIGEQKVHGEWIKISYLDRTAFVFNYYLVKL